MDTLHDVIVWLLFGAVVTGVLINAACMFLSPRAWSHLSWLRAKGQFAERSDSSRWGGWLARITAAILLGGMLWILYDAFVRR